MEEFFRYEREREREEKEVGRRVVVVIKEFFR